MYLIKLRESVNPSHGLVVMVTVWGALYDQSPAPSFITGVIIHGFVALHLSLVCLSFCPHETPGPGLAVGHRDAVRGQHMAMGTSWGIR